MKRTLSILLAIALMLVALPTVAEGETLKAGLYVSEEGTDYMYLYEEGVGVYFYAEEDAIICNAVVWTEASLEVERTKVSFTAEESVLSFVYKDRNVSLSYKGIWNTYALGDQNGTAYIGDFTAENGKTLTLTADGHGVYKDASGQKPIFWGSYRPYLNFAAENEYFILIGGILMDLTFTDDIVILTPEQEEAIAFIHAVEQEPEPEPAMMNLISPAFDLSVSFPTDCWTVEETEGGLLVFLEKDLIQYTFLSLALDKEPTAATLDTYADHVWADTLMGAGIAYDAAETIRGDYTVGEAAGRTAATDWTRDDAVLLGDSVLWYANGRLYVVLCTSNETSRQEALALLDGALLTFRTAEELTLDRELLLPVDKNVFENIRELPAAAPVTEKVYYGYRLNSEGSVIDLLPLMNLPGMDPQTISLILRSDGTGVRKYKDESPVDFTWTEEAFIIEDESVPYTVEGDHLIVPIGEETVEFAPAEEVEAILAEMKQEAPAPVPKMEDLVGTWTYTKYRAMGAEIAADSADSSKSLVLNEDGSAILLTDGSPTEYEWAIREDGKVILTLADVDELVFTYDGTVLTLSAVSNTLEMIFERSSGN